MSSNSNKSCLFVMRSFAHFIYHESTLNELHKRGVSIQLAFDKRWSKGRSDDYINQWIKSNQIKPYIFFPNRNDRWRGFLFHMREVANLGSYLTRKGQSQFYLNRWIGYQHPKLNKILKTPWTGALVKWLVARLYQLRFFSLIESLIPADSLAVNFVKSINPDVVVISPTNLRYSEEIEILKAAKALGVLSVLPVLTWDNLTTKGMLQIEPDILLAWNETHKAEAISIHRINPKVIHKTGSPFFDKWFNSNIHLNFEQCRNRAGLSSASPFVTYLGSSANIAKDESGLVDKLAVGLSGSSDTHDWQILVRAHPANSFNFNKIQQKNVTCWPTPLKAPGELSLPETAEAHEDFLFALRESVAIVGINTSAMIEGLINDRPVIALLIKAFAQTQVEASHFKQLLENDVLYLVESTSECLSLIRKIHNGFDPKKEQRKKFVENYIRLNGEPAGAQQAEKILDLA